MVPAHRIRPGTARPPSGRRLAGWIGLAAALSLLGAGSQPADARAKGHKRIAIHGASYRPPYAAIVVDDNSGQVLYETDPDGLRHPASLTKVMTLYLLFERLEAGKIRLDTQLKVSEHASEQAPTKLGLKPGQTIAVEDAIKAVVTKSANDAAAVIAENLGGSEEAFATQMTQKAHALGMSRTTYVNASGLPDDDQITTARDQALLGRAIQDRFPRLYRFFSTTSFVFHGRTIHGHNHLLGSVSGVDGIKTWYTRASGFNLITSVHRDGRYMVGVVLGGRSAFERDAHMRALIDANIRLASARRTAPVLAEHGDAKYGLASVNPLAKIVSKRAVPQPADPSPVVSATARATIGSSDPIRPVPVKTVSYHTVTVRSASMQPMPVLVPVVGDGTHVAAAEPVAQPAPPVAQPVQRVVEPAPQAPEPQAAEVAAQPAVVEPAHSIIVREPTPAPAKVERAPAEPIKSAPVKQAALPPAPPPHAHGGWIIQIGAYEGEQEARQHLSEARNKVHAALAAADPFTERVQKGDKALYRARFAGFDKTTAEAACRQLKHSDFACLALKD